MCKQYCKNVFWYKSITVWNICSISIRPIDSNQMTRSHIKWLLYSGWCCVDDCLSYCKLESTYQSSKYLPAVLFLDTFRVHDFIKWYAMALLWSVYAEISSKWIICSLLLWILAFSNYMFLFTIDHGHTAYQTKPVLTIVWQQLFSSSYTCCLNVRIPFDEHSNKTRPSLNCPFK